MGGQFGVVDAGPAQKFLVELRLDGADCHEFAVGAGIGPVKVRAAIQQVGLALIGPKPGGLDAVEHGHELRRAVGHGSVHHLAQARTLRFPERGQHTPGQHQCAAAKVAHQVEGRQRLLFGPDGMERTRQGDVVDVVARGLGQGTSLPPAGHAPIDQPRIAGQAEIRP